MSLGPAAHDDDRYAAKVLAIVLGDDSGSRLYWELVDPGIAEVAELSHGEYQGAGVFFTQISCAPEDAEEVYERVMQVYERPMPRASRRPNCSRRRTRSARNSCFPASGPAGGCSASAATGSIAASIDRWKTDLDLVASIRLDQVADVLKRYSLVEGTALTIGPE